MADNGFTRRGALKLGGMVALAGSSSMMMSFSAQGASAPINVITSNSTLTNTLFNILTAQKYLDEFGVSIDTLNVADGSKTVPALLSGGSDLCVINGLGLAMASIAKGAAMKIVGSNSLSPQSAIYSAKPEVKSVKDLEGKIVGVNALGALPHQLMVTIMQKKGVDVSKVTVRNVGSNTDIFRAIAAGTVDAGPSGIDVYYEVDQYGVHVLSDGNLWTEIPDYTYQGAFTSDRAITEKRDVLVRALAAFAKLHRFIQSPESRDSFVNNYKAITSDKDDVQALSAWSFIQKAKPYSTDNILTEEQIRYFQDLNVQMGIQKAIMPFSQVADMSLAHEALKLI